jgi:hypothetical protein
MVHDKNHEIAKIPHVFNDIAVSESIFRGSRALIVLITQITPFPSPESLYNLINKTLIPTPTKDTYGD